MWSTMKPFLYFMALTLWFHPDDLLIDTKNIYPSFQPWRTYISENYTLWEYGLIRFKEALWNSLNNASVRLAHIIWLNDVYDFYQKIGFSFDFPAEYYGYALVLGNPDITLIDLVKNYIQLVPKASEKEYSDKFLLYEILRDPDNRSISFGTNSILNTSIFQAVKTWTSSNFRDNTLISYSSSIVIGVWVGNNDNSPMHSVTGLSWAGRLWHNITEEMIQKNYIIEDRLPIPSDLEKTEYCLDINCFRKELSYQKKWKKYFSRIRSNVYDVRDIKWFIQEDEKYLRDLGFPIRH
jgi:membrane carboxypeptidase/penicillin-binding protein PbpC